MKTIEIPSVKSVDVERRKLFVAHMSDGVKVKYELDKPCTENMLEPIANDLAAAIMGASHYYHINNIMSAFGHSGKVIS